MCCAEADALVAIMFSLVYLVLPLQIEGIADHRLLVVLSGNCGSFAAEVVDTHVLSLLSGYRTKIVGFYASLCIVLILLDMVDGVFCEVLKRRRSSSIGASSDGTDIHDGREAGARRLL